MPSPRFQIRIRTGWPVALVAAAVLVMSATHAWTATVQDSAARRDSAGRAKQKQGTPKATSVATAAPAKPARPKPVWPVNGPTPLPGSILPHKRIVAYYGNPLSKRMGILGEVPPDEMLKRLDREVRAWERADSTTPVVPALHLITIVAQGSPGRDGMYRSR